MSAGVVQPEFPGFSITASGDLRYKKRAWYSLVDLAGQLHGFLRVREDARRYLTRTLYPSGEFLGTSPIRQKTHRMFRIFSEADQRPDQSATGTRYCGAWASTRTNPSSEIELVARVSDLSKPANHVETPEMMFVRRNKRRDQCVDIKKVDHGSRRAVPSLVRW